MKKQYNACDFNPGDLEIPNEDAFGIVESSIEAEIRKHFNDTQFVFVGSISENRHSYIIVCQLSERLQLIAELECVLELTVWTKDIVRR